MRCEPADVLADGRLVSPSACSLRQPSRRPGWITARNHGIPPRENGGKRGWLAGSSGLSPKGASRTTNPHPGGIDGDEAGGDGDRSTVRFAGAGYRHFIPRTALHRTTLYRT